jgi:hypothetical protein
MGLLTAYIGAATAAVIGVQELAKHFRGVPLFVWVTLIVLPPASALVFHVIPTLRDYQRGKRITQITGSLEAGYFSLRPRENEKTFARADGEHEEILEWLKQRSGLLFLSGLSGTGKSSLLNAWVLPHLRAEGGLIIRLRGYQDPLAGLEQEMLRPGVIWQRPPSEVLNILSLMQRACRHIRPRRFFLVFDQFEEFVILQEAEKQGTFRELLSWLCENPIEGLTLLLVFRTDYVGLVEKLGFPALIQDENWKEVPSFTERAAQKFIEQSGLKIAPHVLYDVLREASEIERAKGIMRPITVNLCGLVLSRFTTGFPPGFRSGALISGFIRESVSLPELRDVAPKVIPHLITSRVTTQPRTIQELAHLTTLRPEAIVGCLRRLARADRSIVRPLDSTQQLWEISHDFLVPLLDSTIARWSVSLWQRIRSWLPWGLAAGFSLGFLLVTDIELRRAVTLSSSPQIITQSRFAIIRESRSAEQPNIVVPRDQPFLLSFNIPGPTFSTYIVEVVNEAGVTRLSQQFSRREAVELVGIYIPASSLSEDKYSLRVEGIGANESEKTPVSYYSFTLHFQK